MTDQRWQTTLPVTFEGEGTRDVDLKERSREAANELSRKLWEANEREMMYVFSPELRPEPDPYVWIDPFEGRPSYG